MARIMVSVLYESEKGRLMSFNFTKSIKRKIKSILLVNCTKIEKKREDEKTTKRRSL